MADFIGRFQRIHWRSVCNVLYRRNLIDLNKSWISRRSKNLQRAGMASIKKTEGWWLDCPVTYTYA